jgi:hypothetical protein
VSGKMGRGGFLHAQPQPRVPSQTSPPSALHFCSSAHGHSWLQLGPTCGGMAHFFPMSLHLPSHLDGQLELACVLNSVKVSKQNLNFQLELSPISPAQ